MDKVERARARQLLAAQDIRRAGKKAILSGECDLTGVVSIDHALRAIEAALPNPVSDTRDLGIQEERGCTCHPDERPDPCQHRYALADCKLASAIERDTVDGGVEDLAQDICQAIQDHADPHDATEAIMTELRHFELRRQATDIGALREALQRIAAFQGDPISQDIAKKALSATPAKGV